MTTFCEYHNNSINFAYRCDGMAQSRGAATVGKHEVSGHHRVRRGEVEGVTALPNPW